MELKVSTAIVESFFAKLKKHLESDVIIAGGGPSGLVCATELARKGVRVCLFERNLAPGGGMWGGAMLFNQIVVQQEALHLLDDYGINHELFCDGLHTADSVEATAALIYHARHAGAVIFNGFSIEDVALDGERVSGVVVNWSPVHREGMHVDPLVFRAKAVLDATGHPCEIAAVLSRKNGVKLNTPTGEVMWEGSLDVERGEQATVEHTEEIYPGLFVSGMAACGVSGSCRMGPIFGGMLLSGVRAAKIIGEAIGL
ncbi:MAG: sulfide-dependent adenosine diphosphate thiazole synthase [Candidatus Cloacimonetes bacterium]|nr:sulfide-dependent adenosine diphosphate thiazole synthase [Candidatus Cloacimonadota bacterium]